MEGEDFEEETLPEKIFFQFRELQPDTRDLAAAGPGMVCLREDLWAFQASSIVWKGRGVNNPVTLYTYKEGKDVSAHRYLADGAKEKPAPVEPAVSEPPPGVQTVGEGETDAAEQTKTLDPEVVEPADADSKAHRRKMVDMIRCTGSKDCHCEACNPQQG